MCMAVPDMTSSLLPWQSHTYICHHFQSRTYTSTTVAPLTLTNPQLVGCGMGADVGGGCLGENVSDCTVQATLDCDKTKNDADSSRAGLTVSAARVSSYWQEDRCHHPTTTRRLSESGINIYCTYFLAVCMKLKKVFTLSLCVRLAYVVGW